jgi:hypothetical protein
MPHLVVAETQAAAAPAMSHKQHDVHCARLEAPELAHELTHGGQCSSRDEQGAGVIPGTACKCKACGAERGAAAAAACMH